MDSYRIPTGNGASEYVEKRSRFLGHVRRVETEAEEARALFGELRFPRVHGNIVALRCAHSQSSFDSV